MTPLCPLILLFAEIRYSKEHRHCILYVTIYKLRISENRVIHLYIFSLELSKQLTYSSIILEKDKIKIKENDMYSMQHVI